MNFSKFIEFVDFGDFKVFDSAGIQTMIYIMANSKDNFDYKVQYSKVSVYQRLSFLSFYLL